MKENAEEQTLQSDSEDLQCQTFADSNTHTDCTNDAISARQTQITQSTQTMLLVMTSKTTQVSKKFHRGFHRNISTQTKTYKKNAQVQAKLQPQTRSIMVQTGDMHVSPVTIDSCTNDINDAVYMSSDADGESSIYEHEEDSDSDTSIYEPEEDSDSGSDIDMAMDDNSTAATSSSTPHKKFIVFQSALLTLFTVCQICQESAQGIIKSIVGTLVIIEQACSACGHKRLWHSQPYFGRFPAGNIQLSAAILFTGNSVRKVLRLLNHLDISTISNRTFYRHQLRFLHPSIMALWQHEQTQLLDRLLESGDKLIVGGDGRCDSPGHSAKYGSYTIMDASQKKVLDMQLVQCNETGSSNAMELEGLKRCLQYLQDKGLNIATIVTDRHLQVAKWLRDNCKTIEHRYDVWHVAKSMGKKIDKLAKEKDCSAAGEWRKSVINHMYYTAGSTPSGDGQLMTEKWLSLGNHVQNIHTGHGQLFPTCLHGHSSMKTKWLKPGSKVAEKFVSVISARNVKADVSKLSPHAQTFSVEVFHSVVNQFAPKMFAYSYEGMECRLLLAALHYNENSNKAVATTKDGQIRYCIKFPKFKKGGYTVREVHDDSSYNYVALLLADVIKRCESLPDEDEQDLFPLKPLPMCSSYNRPDKTSAINAHKSRYRQ